MNVRKPVDYSAMFAVLDKLVAVDLPQMELYCEIGRLVSGRPEKGAAVAAAEYLSAARPDATGFSPRNLRRMRVFYHAYVDTPEVLAQAIAIGWTQNVVILEAELTVQERVWYIRAVRKFGWSKLELQRQINAGAHIENALDFEGEMCYTGEKSVSAENPGEEILSEARAGTNQVRRNQPRKDAGLGLLGGDRTGRVWRRRRRENGAAAYMHRLRPAGRNGPGQFARYGLYRTPRRCLARHRGHLAGTSEKVYRVPNVNRSTTNHR